MTAGPDPADQASQPSVPVGAAPSPPTPLQPADQGASAQTVTQVSSSLLSASPESCPTCGKPMAKDQRYCLECGNRRGDPRLPFMDAVVFMEASRQPEPVAAAPSPPREQRGGISNNTALVAGVATLVLAIGVGVLIGRSGDNGSQPAANTAPQVIKVEGGGGGGEVASSGESSGGNTSKSTKSNKPKTKQAKKSSEKLETGSSGTSKAAEEVLKPSADAKPLPPPTTQVGEKCEKGVAGCNSKGEFDGSFFGE